MIKFSKSLICIYRSSSEKISYHFIDGNPRMLFENNITLGLFIKVFIHYILYLTAKHECSSFRLNLGVEIYSINDLITLLTPYVNLLRTSCIECRILSDYLSVADVAYLIVFKSRNNGSLAIDLSVYSRNQQFRLYDCVKRGKKNPLIQSSNFPFCSDMDYSYYDFLGKSLVTKIDHMNLPIVCLINNKFIYKYACTNISLIDMKSNVDILRDINVHYSCFYVLKDRHTHTLCDHSIFQSDISTRLDLLHGDEKILKFVTFVEKVISFDSSCEGFIQSYTRGSKNRNLIFFNIGGKYRFCPLIGRHHQRNTTAILIDTLNHTYCIRCKDPDCNNRILCWNKIE